MNNAILNAFVDDPTVRLIAVLVALDFVLGVVAAVVSKEQAFKLTYLSDALRNDVLGKMVPYYALWAALHVSGIDFEVVGVDAIEESVGAFVVLALVASVVKSLKDLNLPVARSAGEVIAGADPNTPL